MRIVAPPGQAKVTRRLPKVLRWSSCWTTSRCQQNRYHLLIRYVYDTIGNRTWKEVGIELVRPSTEDAGGVVIRQTGYIFTTLPAGQHHFQLINPSFCLEKGQRSSPWPSPSHRESAKASLPSVFSTKSTRKHRFPSSRREALPSCVASTVFKVHTTSSKTSHIGMVCLVPPALEKSMSDMVKTKMGNGNNVGEEPDDSVDQRTALERFVNRTAQDTVLRMEPDYREILEMDQALSKPTGTCSFRAAGVMRLCNKFGEQVKDLNVEEERERSGRKN